MSSLQQPKVRVLFLCTHNSARSQMAEALLRHLAGDRFEAYSAGLEPREIHPYTLRVMEEIGVDMRGQRAKPVDEYLGKVHFGYIITVCSRAEEMCPIFPGTAVRLSWPFEDPAAFEGTEEEKLQRFREVWDQIAARIREWIAETH
ncbi:MAG: arsenate reductase ArsC [Chloroflexia bacterium]